jgi:hypothetical protein
MTPTSSRARWGAAATLSVSSESPGIVIRVRGHLDDTSEELLREVVRAALVTMRRADRVHLDLRSLERNGAELPRIVRRMARAGAIVTPPLEERSDLEPSRRRWAF